MVQLVIQPREPSEPGFLRRPGTFFYARLKRLSWLDDKLDHGRKRPLFVRFRTSDGGAPAPLAPTHYREAMCLAVRSESADQKSTGTLSTHFKIVRIGKSPRPPDKDGLNYCIKAI